ncbi:MAG: hypothetical protein AAGE52_39290 [Myxococcota bacterium]
MNELTRFGTYVSLLGLLACASPARTEPSALSNSLLLELSLDYERPPFPLLVRPERFEVVLSLDEAEGIVRGSIGPHHEGTTRLDPVEGTVEDGVISLDEGMFRFERGRLRWTEFTLDPATGEGLIVGRWQQSDRDVFDESEVTIGARVMNDTRAGIAALRVASLPASRPMVWTPLAIDMNEPMDASALDAIRILADEAPLAGDLDAEVIAGSIASLTFTPSAPMPFSADLRLDLGGTVDTAGLPFEVREREMQVIDDPGSLLTNPGFEEGLLGWFASGIVGTVEEFGGVAPAEGRLQAVVTEESILGGYFDVPPAATRLRVRGSLFSEVGDLDPDRSAVVRLQSDARDVRTFDFFDFVDEGEPSDVAYEDSYRHRIGPMEVSLDLADLRGERVYLTVQARAANFIGANFYAILLDDVVIDEALSPVP